MSQPYEPYPVQPEQPPTTGHVPGYGAANPYYVPHIVGQPKELTLTAILAAGSAVALTTCALVQAVVVGDALRTTDPTDLSFLVYGGSSLLYLLLLVASYVATCLWLWRARQNSELLDPGHHHARSRGWVWGGWVCPIVNLWFPFQVVKGIHLASTRGFGSAGALIGWWWAAWLGFLFSMRVSDSVATEAMDSGDARNAEGVAVLAALLSVVAVVLWVQVIRRTTRIQHEALGLG